MKLSSPDAGPTTQFVFLRRNSVTKSNILFQSEPDRKRLKVVGKSFIDKEKQKLQPQQIVSHYISKQEEMEFSDENIPPMSENLVCSL